MSDSSVLLEITCVIDSPVPGEIYLDTFMPIAAIHIFLIFILDISLCFSAFSHSASPVTAN